MRGIPDDLVKIVAAQRPFTSTTPDTRSVFTVLLPFKSIGMLLIPGLLESILERCAMSVKSIASRRLVLLAAALTSVVASIIVEADASREGLGEGRR